MAVIPTYGEKDRFGNLIRKSSYGTKGLYGWVLDLKNPESKGGTDKPPNIESLYWEEKSEEK